MLPLGRIIGDCFMIAQIAGGIGLFYPRTMRLASIVLSVVYALFALACVPGIIAAPAVYAQYDSFFEQLALLCGAIALYVVTEQNVEKATMLHRLARIGLGLCAISFALAQAVYLHLTADLVPKWIPPNQMFWAILTTIAFALAAVALLINRQARRSARLMGMMIAIFGILVWVPLLIAHPEAHLNWSEFVLTFLIAGSAWVVSGSLLQPQ